MTDQCQPSAPIRPIGPDDLDVYDYRSPESIELLVDVIRATVAGDTIRIVTITGLSLLREATVVGRPGQELQAALERGCTCQMVVIDPLSPEAGVRIEVESPGVPPERSVLRLDAEAALATLDEAWTPFVDRLTVRASRVSLPSNLWLLPGGARVEPYHLGQLPELRADPMAPFEGLVHVWFGPQRGEYARLADHFNQLWQRGESRWPAAR